MNVSEVPMSQFILSIVVLAAALIQPQSTPAVLSGRLTTPQGDPVSGVRVIALSTAYPRLDISSQTETESNGRFRLDNVPPGEYFIVADPFDFPSYFPGTGNRDDSRRVAVPAGATIGNLDFALIRISGILRVVRTPSQGAPRFSGVLRDTKGDGIPDIAIKLTHSQTQERYWTVSNASGAFQYQALRAGDYSMETFAGGILEEPKLSITLRAGESLEQEIGLRSFGNWQQRPDLYAKGDLRERQEHLRMNGPGERIFWRCQNLDQQVQPQYPQAARDAGIRGSVTLQINVDATGKLVWIRVVSPDANPDFARAAVDSVAQWRFTPIKQMIINVGSSAFSCNGDGEVVPFQGTVTFNFPQD
jgi:TonB family protein